MTGDWDNSEESIVFHINDEPKSWLTPCGGLGGFEVICEGLDTRCFQKILTADRVN